MKTDLDQNEVLASLDRLELEARSLRAQLVANGQKPQGSPARTADIIADHETLSAYVGNLRAQCQQPKTEAAKPEAPAATGKLNIDERVKAAVRNRKDSSEEAEKAILADFRTGKISMSDAVKRIKALK